MGRIRWREGELAMGFYDLPAFVECAECGHAIEQHDRKGCHVADGCPCPLRWTVAQIRQVRKDNGLPARF